MPDKAVRYLSKPSNTATFNIAMNWGDTQSFDSFIMLSVIIKSLIMCVVVAPSIRQIDRNYKKRFSTVTMAIKN